MGADSLGAKNFSSLRSRHDANGQRMRQGPHSKRGRGRGGNRRSGTPNRNQTFDSNGPDVRIRGNAHQVHEKYLNLARDASASGDRVLAESYFQYAEHYFRILSAFSEDPNNEANRQRTNGYQSNGSGQPYDGEPQPDVERPTQSAQPSGQTEGSSPVLQSPDAQSEETGGRRADPKETTAENAGEAENSAGDAPKGPTPLSLPSGGNGKGSSKDTSEQVPSGVKVTMVGASAEEDQPVAPIRPRRRRQPSQASVSATDTGEKVEE